MLCNAQRDLKGEIYIKVMKKNYYPENGTKSKTGHYLAAYLQGFDRVLLYRISVRMLLWKPAASGDSLLRLLTKFLKRVFKELFNTERYEHTHTHNTTETLGPELIRSQISLMADSVGCLVQSWSPDSSQICLTVIALIRVSESCVVVYLLQLSPPGKGPIQILQSLID